MYAKLWGPAFAAAVFFALPALADTAAVPPVVLDATDEQREQITRIDQAWRANPRRGRRELDRWIDRDDNAAVPLVAAAGFWFRDGKYGKCLSYSAKALRIDPRNAAAFYWRGRAFEAKSQPTEAANEYKAALLAYAQFSQAREALARVTGETLPSDPVPAGDPAP